jgi:two-component system NtrC family sensor kinase
MRTFFSSLLGGRLQIVLVAAFSLVAGLTVVVNTLATSRVINEYLGDAMNDRVGRDMDLAGAYYQLKLQEVVAVDCWLARNPLVIQNLTAASQGQTKAIQIIDQQINKQIASPAQGSPHFSAVLDTKGNILAARSVSPQGKLSPLISQGNWGDLPIVKEVLSTGREQAATEIISVEFLAQVGLDEQAHIALRDTPLAAPETFDSREGTAGLALIAVFPLQDEQGFLLGTLVAAYLFNNDFTLVDRIKEVAGIDTATIFFGDLRVSTNVMTKEGKRAVGTRVSQDVYDVVLEQGRDYVGRAYVVNEWFITRYEPLRDYRGRVVGSLYVGARESTFLRLIHTFNNRVALIALVCIALAGIIAVPIARLITRPVAALVKANRLLARGDMTVRVRPYGNGELAVLGHSFNSMVETLHETQQELLHKENLASMGQLAAGVAHELNNPLGTILLYADILYKEASEGDACRDDLQMIIKETNRCKIIVRDLLNFARQNKVMAQTTDLNQLLEKVVAEQEKHPKFENVDIVLQLDADLPTIQADPLQLQQVLINLMNNAAEAMEVKGEGTLTIATRPASFGEGIEISVTDTGVGISEENKAKLFAPFFTTKPVGKGTGLGLAIVYGIVKMHRGQIQVQSEVGKGTAFAITLPMSLPMSSEATGGIGTL